MNASYIMSRWIEQNIKPMHRSWSKAPANLCLPVHPHGRGEYRYLLKVKSPF